jgi:pimeloyl-ACP methyl ester carboxylesterase
MTPIRIAGTALLRRPGEGPVVLLLHGIGSDAESWAPVVRLLPPGLDVIAPYAPGYGASDPVAPAAPTPEEYAVRLGAVLDALGLRRVMLAGHSLGALFAGRFAASRPDRVAALALLSPALGYRTPPAAPMPSGVQARLDELRALGPAAFAERRAARLLHRPDARPAAFAAVRRAMGAVRPDGYAQACRALAAGDLLADAARIGRAASVMVGAEDVVTPPDNARALHAALPKGSSLDLVPEAGHALPQEAPERVAELLVREAAHA